MRRQSVLQGIHEVRLTVVSCLLIPGCIHDTANSHGLAYKLFKKVVSILACSGKHHYAISGMEPCSEMGHSLSMNWEHFRFCSWRLFAQSDRFWLIRQFRHSEDARMFCLP
jgi:hypothetical protein